MGATSFFTRATGNSPTEAYNEAVREALYERGHGGYTGTIAEKSGYALFNIPHIHQVYLLFRGRLLDLDFFPGDESLETKLVSEAEIPWNELAFATVRSTLRHYYDDRRHGEYRFHMGTIEPMGTR